MGISGSSAHKSAKKSIKKNIVWYKGLHPDKRAGMIFYVWLARGINLSEVGGNSSLFIPIYYYSRGAESVLMDVKDSFKSSGNIEMYNAACHHFYTNLAVSYPDEGYGILVREMWRTLFENYTDLNEVVAELTSVLERPNI